MGLFDSLFGKRHNVERGKDVEAEWRANQEIQGNSYKRRAVGSDYERTVTDPYTGRKHTERWEMKRNDSPVSKTQKNTRGLKVYRSYDPSPKRPFGETKVEDKHGNELERDMFSGKYRKVPKRQSDPFGFNIGNSPKPRRTKANDDPFGVGSMFSGSSSTSKKRRKSDDPFGLFG
jgi:hypothetical protein